MILPRSPKGCGYSGYSYPLWVHAWCGYCRYRSALRVRLSCGYTRPVGTGFCGYCGHKHARDVLARDRSCGYSGDMPYPPRPPTGQAVSAALKRAGFSRSAALAGTGRYHWDGKLVRGSEQYSEGYEVRTVDGRITVRHKLGGAGAANEENVRRAVRKVLRYADTLLLAGFQPRIDEGGRSLIVCARTR